MTMQPKPLSLTEPWNSFYVQIEVASQHFWQQAPYQNHGRLQNLTIWSFLRKKLQELLDELFKDAPLTPFETFLLSAATHLYEIGWQVPGASEATVAQRYALSGTLIQDSYQRRENMTNLGLTKLDSTTVGTLAHLCTAVGQIDLSMLSCLPEPGGNQETVRLRYLVALLQIANELLVPRQKVAYFHKLPRIREREDARLALHPYIDMFSIKANSLIFYPRINPMDSQFKDQIVACIEEPILRWWAANWRWLAEEFQVEMTIHTNSNSVISQGIPPEPLHQTCRALLSYLTTYKPSMFVLPTLSQVRTTCTEGAAKKNIIAIMPKQGETPAMPEPPERYIDFYLRIDRHGYATAHSSEGEAHADINLIVPSSIDLALDLVSSNTKNASLYKNLGRQLYELILPGTINTHFQKTEAVARKGREKIRIRMDIEAEMLARLPLEFLYREDRGHFLAIDPHTALSRYLHVSYPRNRVRLRTGPLYMLTIISSPADQARLDIDQWCNIIVQALAEPVKRQQLELAFVTSGTYEEISRALLKRKPDIIQFVGHGIYRDETCYLALENEDGNTWLVNDDSFASLFLGSLDNLGLVCLATCESATSDDPQSFLGLAPKLIQRGVPAVIAMQYSVKISTAELFLRYLYQNVAEYKPIDWAVQQARNAISIREGNNNREFATPILYMRAEDGDIFDSL